MLFVAVMLSWSCYKRLPSLTQDTSSLTTRTPTRGTLFLTSRTPAHPPRGTLTSRTPISTPPEDQDTLSPHREDTQRTHRGTLSVQPVQRRKLSTRGIGAAFAWTNNKGIKCVKQFSNEFRMIWQISEDLIRLVLLWDWTVLQGLGLGVEGVNRVYVAKLIYSEEKT